ncbi:hypothetical protein KBB96_05000 [Luteolibacter ambystomatis]|uniref:Uncharacterized protein n=1 Tax=Luteolibacter ambystomatis TaxID=2824561 RepID=A0A975J1E4_9BACT|nr:hypothetical protein [Luteolibacter ambystomatis]QUE52250.1 hypothetical protein KBB96_05000 [Luteolibacter ambystomatis]
MAKLGSGPEPKLVYNLFLKGEPDWQAALGQWNPSASYGVVFTHQKPLVTYTASSGASSTCELADVLIVLTDNSSKTRRAVLFQAKIAGGSWPPANKMQWELLTTWPSFDYTPHGASTKVTRLLPFSGRQDPGAQYLTIDTGKASILSTLALKPKPSSASLDEFIYDFLNASSGRGLSWSQSTSKDDWDELIWDLISSMKRVVTTVGGTSNQPRVIGAFLQLVGHARNEGDGGDDEPDKPDEWGIPVLVHIEVGSND